MTGQRFNLTVSLVCAIVLLAGSLPASSAAVGTGACCDWESGDCYMSPPEDCQPPYEWLGEDVPCDVCQPMGANGACCDWETGDCYMSPPEECWDPYEWLGEGVPCDECQPMVEFGACCLEDGQCIEDTMDYCEIEMMGRWLGPETMCLGDLNGNNIDDACEDPQPAGACCDWETGDCYMSLPEECQPPYEWLGEGVSCDECQPMVEFGACCLEDGGCIEDTMDYCEIEMMGRWLGPGTTCSGIMEACCLEDGACMDTEPLCCDAVGGTPQGPGTACVDMTITCCLDDGTCMDIDPICCDDQGGTPGYADMCLGDLNGNGVDDACEEPQPAGACCLQDGGCIDDTMEDICDFEMLGAWLGPGSQCLGDNDPPNGIDDACERRCPGEGSCFEEHPTPGCDDEGCCNAVCDDDLACCVVEWDEECVQIAWEVCKEDCNGNGIPDECDIDCSAPGCDMPDCGGSEDCQPNGVPDECDIDEGTSVDENYNGIPDECELDCNENGIPDECDIDCGTPEGRCDIAGCGGSEDCQPNGVPDECDIADGTSADENYNGIPDDCEPQECSAAGQECFTTYCDGTQANFGDTPIPADFFAPGSDPFDGVIPLGGEPIGPGDTDTIVERLGDLCFIEPPSAAQVPIQLVELSLISCEPITVTSDGGGNPEDWDVEVGLSDTPVPDGTLTAMKTHANGGTYVADYYVQPVFTFTRVGDPGDVRTLDTGAEGQPPIQMHTELYPPWSTDPSCDCSPDGFAPGVGEDGIGDPCGEEVCHSSGGMAPHVHCVRPPDCPPCEQPGACCLPDGGCTVIDPELCIEILGGYPAPGGECLGDIDENGIDDGCENFCPPDAQGSCFVEHGPGCDDEDCCNAVCDEDPYCCTTEWDDICVQIAQEVCGEPTGACCDDSTGICNDSVTAENCQPPLRFVEDTSCADIDPPCAALLGACCLDDGSCQILTEADCVANGGIYFIDETCEPNPCPQPPTDCAQSPFPACDGDCPANEICVPDTALGVCGCEPESITCEPKADGAACEDVTCPDTTDTCQPRCMNYDPTTGESKVIDCECRSDNECHAEGGDVAPPTCVGGCPLGMICTQTVTTMPDGTVDICCDCVELPPECEPTLDGDACEDVECPNPDDQCQPRCKTYNPETGQVTVTDCKCREPSGCHADGSSVPNPCLVPDNGTGTVTLPPIGCEYLSPDEVFEIIDGLPPGTTIEFDPQWMDFLCCPDGCDECSLPLPPDVCERAGGSLGGDGHCFESTLELTVNGTGELAGFNRQLSVELFTEIHTGPRNPGDPIQDFDTEMVRLEGKLFVNPDPDFCTFKLRGGTYFGLPSPGVTDLTQLPSGDFSVDSFFDITYQIEFEGCVGSPLEGYNGTTTGTLRMQTGGLPGCSGACPPDLVCREEDIINADGTIEICCDCMVPEECEPTDDGLGCEIIDCPDPQDECEPMVVRREAPPVSFPPAGIDYLDPTTALVDIDFALAVETVELTGPTTVLRSDPYPAGTHRVIDTEIVAMDLAGMGTMGPVSIQIAPSPLSPGVVIGADDPTNDYPADSFFDIFVTIDIAGLTLHNQDPIPVQALGITDVPPLGESFETPPDWPGVELITPDGQPTGLFIRKVIHTLPPAPPEWQVIECDCIDAETQCHIELIAGAAPGCAGPCPPGQVCDEIVTNNPDGSTDIECDCVQSQPRADYGDAPDPAFPSLFASGGPHHLNLNDCYVGPLPNTVNAEGDAQVPDMDVDDGSPLIFASQAPDGTWTGWVYVPISINIAGGAPQMDRYLNVLLDGNSSGTWCDQPGEWVVRNHPLWYWSTIYYCVGGFSWVGDYSGWHWLRVTVSEQKVTANVTNGWDGSVPGAFQYGETEDWLVQWYYDEYDEIGVPGAPPPPHNPANPPLPKPIPKCNKTGTIHQDPPPTHHGHSGGFGIVIKNTSPNHPMHIEEGPYPTNLHGDPIDIELPNMYCTWLQPGEKLRVPGGWEFQDEPPNKAWCDWGVLVDPGDPPVTVEIDNVGNYRSPTDDQTTGGSFEERVPGECEPTPDGSACEDVECSNPNDQCQPRCMNFNPETGQTTVTDCECRPPDDCHVEPSGLASGNPCVEPDNGTGTITLPPMCDYLSPDEVFMIIDGLPPGTTIELDPRWKDFVCCPDGCDDCSLPLQPGECEMPGGTLGGDGDCFESMLELTVHGTGELEGFNRTLFVPLFTEVHTGPRNPGDPVQDFDTDMYRLLGELLGDQDFCELKIIGGTDFGLPGPGHTTLTRLPSGDFAVDSFFDITYQIEFEGCPGSVLDGYMGTTTGTIRMDTGAVPPVCNGDCPPDHICKETVTQNADGTIDICCDCIGQRQACCLPEGDCVQLLPTDCRAQNGTPLGPGTVCSGTVEACCLPDGDCIDADPLCCVQQMSGTPQGSETACFGTTFACCRDDGTTCEDVDLLCCDDLGGTPGYSDMCLGDRIQNGIDDACEEPCACIGDMDDSGQRSLADLDALVNLLVGVGPPFIVPCPDVRCYCADFDDSGQVTLGDLDAMVNLLVNAGPPFIAQCP